MVSAATTPAVDLNDPVVRFASNGRSADSAATTAYALSAMPAVLEAGTVVMFLPADQGIVPELRSRYPGGELEVVRDLQANPRLYLYRLP